MMAVFSGKRVLTYPFPPTRLIRQKRLQDCLHRCLPAIFSLPPLLQRINNVTLQTQDISCHQHPKIGSVTITKAHINNLLLRHKTFPCLVVKKNTDLRNATLRFVNIFHFCTNRISRGLLYRSHSRQNLVLM